MHIRIIRVVVGPAAHLLVDHLHVGVVLDVSSAYSPTFLDLEAAKDEVFEFVGH